MRILEGQKDRVQVFSGVVISRRGSGMGEMFTVRRIVQGEGVERQFPLKFAAHRQDRSETHGRRPSRQTLLPARLRR